VGDQVQVTMALRHPTLDLEIWENTYTGEVSNLFRLEQQVSEDTIREVRLDRKPEDPAQVARRDTTNPEAREYYYKGIHNLRGANLPQTEKAIAFFDQAIAIDEHFALAHLGRARAYVLQSTLGVAPHVNNEPALASANRAIELDENLAGAWAVLGQVQLSYQWKWEESKASLTKALQLDPYLPEAHAGMASYYVSIGEFDLCVEHLRKAIQIDPGSLLVHESIMYTPFFTRNMDVAIEFCQHAIDLDDDYWSPHAWMGLALTFEGEYDAALVHLEEAWRLESDSPIALALLASAYAKKGLHENDPALIEKAKAHRDTLVDWFEAEYICPYELATVFVALGEMEEALSWVEMAEKASSECIPFMGVDIRMDELRDEQRFNDVMERVGHPLFGEPKPWIEAPERPAEDLPDVA
jgi:tetratricopeptide (TPR) repeat protein